MRVKTVELVGFKRFDHLTIDLGHTPKKIVAMVGPNGCGKSSVFDGFEQELKKFRNHGAEDEEFYSKRAVLVNFVFIEFAYARTTSLSFIRERANP